jgi:hypothetical protein
MRRAARRVATLIMADSTSYRPLADLDQSFPLVAEPTLGTMRTIRRLQVRAACIPREQRARLAEKMAWEPEEVVVDEVGEPAYYAELGKVLFGKRFSDKLDERGDAGVAYKEVLRALAAFF